MVSRKLTSSFFLATLLVFLPAFVVEAKGQDLPRGVRTDEGPPGRCSLATLKGGYGVLEQGTVVGQLPGFPPPPFPVAISANPTYDGAGNFSGTFAASFGGAIVPGTFTGTYTVNPDCTYSDEFAPLPDFVVHHAGTITGEGIFRQIDYIYTDAGVVIFGTAKKTLPWGCSLRTLEGTYEVFGQGTDTSYPIPGFPSPPFPGAHVGTFTADGAGHFSGKNVEKVDVVYAPTTYTATYTVNPDCTVSATITDSMGLVIHETGTITGWGESQEVHTIFTDPGWVFVDTAKKQQSRSGLGLR
jgi:hypothetical protein